MNYEIAYKNALETAKNYYFQGLPKEILAKLEAIFPELKDNDDERFKKYLLLLCEDALLNNEGILLSVSTTEKLKKWIEKQEDYSEFTERQQKYIEKYKHLDKITLIKLLAERDMNTEEVISSFDSSQKQEMQGQAEQPDYCNAYDEKTKKCDSEIIDIINLALISSENELSSFYKAHDISREECSKWLKSQKFGKK